MSKLNKILLSLILSLSFLELGKLYFFSPQQASIELNSVEILNRTPKKLKEDGRPYGTGGVLFYTYKNNVLYILLSRESEGSDKKGTYCEFGGSLELTADGKPETFMQGCIRECFEESAGLYNLKESDFKNSKVYLEISPTQREIILCFMETDQIFTTDELLKAHKKFDNPKFKEKDKLLWVKASDLLKESQKIVDEEMKEEIKIRSFLKDILQKPKVKEILQHIINKS